MINNTSRGVLLIFLTLCFLLFQTSCRHCNVEHNSVLPESLPWIPLYDSSVFFTNENGDSAQCHYHFKYANYVHQHSPWCDGKDCFDYTDGPCEEYQEQILATANLDSLNIFFDYKLDAGYPDYDWFGVNEHYYDSTAEYQTCAMFVLYMKVDSIYPFPISSGIDYYDEIDLNGTVFSKVYHKVSECYEPVNFSVSDFYFSKDKKIVAFKITDGHLWALK